MPTGPVKQEISGMNTAYRVIYTEQEYKSIGSRAFFDFLYFLTFLGIAIYMWVTGNELIFFSQAVLFVGGALGFLRLAAAEYSRTL